MASWNGWATSASAVVGERVAGQAADVVAGRERRALGGDQQAARVQAAARVSAIASRIAWSSALRLAGLSIVRRTTCGAGSSRRSLPSASCGARRHSRTTRVSPSETAWPSSTRISLTVPSSSASTGISIFIDSRITTVSPSRDRVAHRDLDLPDRARDVGLDVRHECSPSRCQRCFRGNTSDSSDSTRSRNSSPSRWSISCWIARASKPSASTRRPSGLDGDVRGAAHVAGQLGDAEAALAAHLRAGGGDDHRVDQDELAVVLGRLRVSGAVDHGDADQLADLRRGDADAVAEAAHRVQQVGDDAAGVRRRLRAPREQRVGVEQDVADQRTSASTGRRVRATPWSAATACSRASSASSPSSGGTATSMIIT